MRNSNRNNSKEKKNITNTRTSFSKEFAVRLDEADRLVEKSYLG
jgi:hypothetical protein